MPVTNVALKSDWIEADSFGLIAVEAMFRFLGTDVRVMSESVALLQHWTAMYGAFRIPPAPAEITVRVHGAADTAPAPGQVTIEREGVRRVWNGGGAVLPPLAMPPLDRWVYLHGAAVGRAGQAVLLLGEPRAGKTLVGLSVVARGARLLGDGLLPLDPGDLLLAPFPEAVRLRREELSLLSIDPAHPALVPFHDAHRAIRWRADPRALLGLRAGRVAAGVAAIVFLEPAAGVHTPSLERLPCGEALGRLLRYVDRRSAAREGTEAVLSGLSRQVPAYTLVASPLDAAARAIDEVLLA
jgi:hypothetical protein